MQGLLPLVSAHLGSPLILKENCGLVRLYAQPRLSVRS